MECGLSGSNPSRLVYKEAMERKAGVQAFFLEDASVSMRQCTCLHLATGVYAWCFGFYSLLQTMHEAFCRVLGQHRGENFRNKQQTPGVNKPLMPWSCCCTKRCLAHRAPLGWKWGRAQSCLPSD